MPVQNGLEAFLGRPLPKLHHPLLIRGKTEALWAYVKKPRPLVGVLHPMTSEWKYHEVEDPGSD